MEESISPDLLNESEIEQFYRTSYVEEEGYEHYDDEHDIEHGNRTTEKSQDVIKNDYPDWVVKYTERNKQMDILNHLGGGETCDDWLSVESENGNNVIADQQTDGITTNMEEDPIETEKTQSLMVNENEEVVTQLSSTEGEKESLENRRRLSTNIESTKEVKRPSQMTRSEDENLEKDVGPNGFEQEYGQKDESKTLREISQMPEAEKRDIIKEIGLEYDIFIQMKKVVEERRIQWKSCGYFGTVEEKIIGVMMLVTHGNYDELLKRVRVARCKENEVKKQVRNNALQLSKALEEDIERKSGDCREGRMIEITVSLECKGSQRRKGKEIKEMRGSKQREEVSITIDQESCLLVKRDDRRRRLGMLRTEIEECGEIQMIVDGYIRMVMSECKIMQGEGKMGKGWNAVFCVISKWIVNEKKKLGKSEDKIAEQLLLRREKRKYQYWWRKK